MRDQNEPKLAKWPFYIGDSLLVGAAWFIYLQSKLPMGPWQIAFVVLCVGGGALLGVMPFLLEYRVFAKLAEARELATVVSQMKNLETLSAQISGATGQWMSAQESADRTAAVAKGLADKIGAEAKAFTEFLQKAGDAEKAALRLELDKLHRMEAEWLQVLVRILDNTYALYQGGVRSGQGNLIEQLGNFQSACRDTARRVGLTPFVPAEGERFDAQKHQVADGNGKPPEEGIVGETVATGYTFQGRVLRPALVRLRNRAAAERDDVKVIISAPKPESPASLPLAGSLPAA